MAKKLEEEAKKREAVKPKTLKIRLSLSNAAKPVEKEKEVEKEVAPVVEPQKKKRKHLGMQPKQIFNGFYDDKNKRMKQTVFNGALNIPSGVLDMVRDAIQSVAPDALKGTTDDFELPSVLDIERPSIDPNMALNFLITELRAGQNGTTLVTARRQALPSIERIRGGGDDDVVMNDVNAPAPAPQAAAIQQQPLPQSIEPNPVVAVASTEQQAQAPVPVVAPAPAPVQPVAVEPTPVHIPINVEPTPVFNTAIATSVPVQAPVAPVPSQPAAPSTAPLMASSTPTAVAPSVPTLSTSEKEEPKEKEPKPTINALPDSNEKEEEKELKGMQEPSTKFPSWYNKKAVSDIEKSLLQEWFNNSAEHRSEATYIVAREGILEAACKSSAKYLTSSAVRRCVAGDAGSIMRLFEFLVHYGFINGSAIGDHAPLQVTNEVIKPTPALGEKWTSKMTQVLGAAVARSSKKRKLDDESMERLEVDWESVATEVGCGLTPEECYEKFISTDFSKVTGEEEDVQVNDLSPSSEDTSRQDLIAELVDGVKPEVAKAVVDAALQATSGETSEAQKAAVLGVVASKAAAIGEEEEKATSRILDEIIDLRMSKLENRLSLLDDLEGMLDAERMALELERRDLYTNRCRYWFNADASS